MIKIFSLLILLTSSVSLAAPALSGLTVSDHENISKEFSNNFSHASVMGAKTLGDIFGFELALTAGQTASPELDKFVKRAGGSSIDKLYHAGLLLGVSVPFGITGEVVYTPKTTASDVSFNQTSMAIKLTLNKELLPMIPFNLAIRAFSTSSTLSFKQTVLTFESTVTNTDNVTGYQLLLSPDLPIVEPYAGIGMLSAKDSLSSSDFAIFANGNKSNEASLSSTQTLLGVNVYAFIFSMGLEYARAFESDRYTAKLGFYF